MQPFKLIFENYTSNEKKFGPGVADVGENSPVLQGITIAIMHSADCSEKER